MGLVRLSGTRPAAILDADRTTTGARIAAAKVAQCVVDTMSMLDITGHYAIPLAHPFSDVPPPYGRRRRPFVANRRQRPNVFDLRGANRAQAAVPVSAARPVRAQDFGSDNRAWIRPHPMRRRWRMTLMATALFGVVCVVATHLVDERAHVAEPGSVYAGAISIAPEAIIAAPVAAVSAMVDAAEASDVPSVSNASATKPVVSPEVTSAASMSAGTHPARNDDAAKTQPARDVSRSTKVARSMPEAARAYSAVASKPAVVAHDRKAHDDTSGQHRAAPVAEVVRAAPLHAHDNDRLAAQAAASTSGSAAAVGMTAAEFTHWLAATREVAQPVAGATDLTVDLPGHPRLIER
ncbi:serine protease [Burkholderia sp. AU31624]|uniref:serine protease n=1 Tax=Burkholderia sp. AU31624 TaxID=2879629 RepID=UPI001CF57976|nr:serine protease [Burkholderia sp. AU31624]MCA8252665.1 serine protease [Burkholderia sp. AU31624]